jgi:hypothetical protein
MDDTNIRVTSLIRRETWRIDAAVGDYFERITTERHRESEAEIPLPVMFSQGNRLFMSV